MPQNGITSGMFDPVYRVVVIISGRGSNLQALAARLAQSDTPASVVGVISDKRAAKGLEFAESAGIDTRVVPRKKKLCSLEEYNSRLAEVVTTFQPDLIVLAGFMRVLTTEFISQFPERIINIHPSLLPSFKGLDVHQRVIDASVPFSGCTIHFVTEEVDAGPIISQAVVPVFAKDSAETLAARVLKREHMVLPAVVRGIAEGAIILVEIDGRTRVKIDPDWLGCDENSYLLSLRS